MSTFLLHFKWSDVTKNVSDSTTGFTFLKGVKKYFV